MSNDVAVKDWVTIPIYAWRDWKKPWKSKLRIAILGVENRSRAPEYETGVVSAQPPRSMLSLYVSNEDRKVIKFSNLENMQEKASWPVSKYYYGIRLETLRKFILKPSVSIRGCNQKFPDWVDKKYMLTFGITRWEATQRIMTAKLTRLTHKTATQCA
jgi:hypothetical protein